jgi:hypothetical protein
MEDFIKLENGEVINHGDIVFATLEYNDESVDVIGKLCINQIDTIRKYYVCQNECNGDSAAEDKFGFNYSWSFVLEDGVITSGDTTYLSIYPQQELEEPEYDGAGYTKDDRKIDNDDDPMPDDWTPEEELPKDL